MSKLKRTVIISAVVVAAVVTISWLLYPTAKMLYHSLTHTVDEHDLYYIDGGMYEPVGEFDEGSVEFFTEKLSTLKDMLPTDSNFYYSIIPNKAYYIEDNPYDVYDYDAMFTILGENLSEFTYIDITNNLSLDSYFLTDNHWKQEELGGVMGTLGEAMNLSPQSVYSESVVEGFSGLYARRAEVTDTEQLSYLTSSATEQVKVHNAETDTVHDGVYDYTALESDNLYDMFLYGAAPVLTITNDSVDTERELLIFRDSFAAALVPLMLDSYSKITVVDLRFISTELLPDYADLEADDVLFLYSTELVNNARLLR